MVWHYLLTVSFREHPYLAKRRHTFQNHALWLQYVVYVLFQHGDEFVYSSIVLASRDRQLHAIVEFGKLVKVEPGQGFLEPITVQTL